MVSGMTPPPPHPMQSYVGSLILHDLIESTSSLKQIDCKFIAVIPGNMMVSFDKHFCLLFVRVKSLSGTAKTDISGCSQMQRLWGSPMLQNSATAFSTESV